jgi:hypothetical protein
MRYLLMLSQVQVVQDNEQIDDDDYKIELLYQYVAGSLLVVIEEVFPQLTAVVMMR